MFDLTATRRLLDAAAALPDNERARQRGPTYRTIFALCYGLGLRAGEVCGLRLGDVDPQRDLLVVRGGKFGKTRLVPYGPRIGELIAEHVARRGADGALATRHAAIQLRRAPVRASRHRQSGVPPLDGHP